MFVAMHITITFNRVLFFTLCLHVALLYFYFGTQRFYIHARCDRKCHNFVVVVVVLWQRVQVSLWNNFRVAVSLFPTRDCSVFSLASAIRIVNLTLNRSPENRHCNLPQLDSRRCCPAECTMCSVTRCIGSHSLTRVITRNGDAEIAWIREQSTAIARVRGPELQRADRRKTYPSRRLTSSRVWSSDRRTPR